VKEARYTDNSSRLDGSNLGLFSTVLVNNDALREIRLETGDRACLDRRGCLDGLSKSERPRRTADPAFGILAARR
jgi:hypothetical protein